MLTPCFKRVSVAGNPNISCLGTKELEGIAMEGKGVTLLHFNGIMRVNINCNLKKTFFSSRACVLISILFIISGIALNIKAAYNLSKEWIPYFKVTNFIVYFFILLVRKFHLNR